MNPAFFEPLNLCSSQISNPSNEHPRHDHIPQGSVHFSVDPSESVVSSTTNVMKSVRNELRTFDSTSYEPKTSAFSSGTSDLANVLAAHDPMLRDLVCFGLNPSESTVSSTTVVMDESSSFGPTSCEPIISASYTWMSDSSNEIPRHDPIPQAVIRFGFGSSDNSPAMSDPKNCFGVDTMNTFQNDKVLRGPSEKLSRFRGICTLSTFKMNGRFYRKEISRRFPQECDICKKAFLHSRHLDCHRRTHGYKCRESPIRIKSEKPRRKYARMQKTCKKKRNTGWKKKYEYYYG